ncbi:MAG: hypothetical protein FWD55_08310 [Propionibacteriaceae bacterium]|nr:hypothetical protein [Propionibacteriaceae bacterium]
MTKLARFLSIAAACLLAAIMVAGMLMTKADQELVGSYSPQRSLYLSPLSSSLFDPAMTRAFALTQDSLLVGDPESKEAWAYSLTWEQTSMTIDEFAEHMSFFSATAPSLEGISSIQRLAVASVGPARPYELFQVDNEIWLVTTVDAPTETTFAWSVVVITKSYRYSVSTLESWVQ